MGPPGRFPWPCGVLAKSPEPAILPWLRGFVASPLDSARGPPCPCLGRRPPGSWIAPFRPIDWRSGRFYGAGLAQQTRGSPSHHPDCALLNPNLRTKAMTAALSPVVVLSWSRRGCAVGLLAVSVETMRLRIGFAGFRECNQHNRGVTASTPTNRRVTDQACTIPGFPDGREWPGASGTLPVLRSMCPSQHPVCVVVIRAELTGACQRHTQR